jgi:uncharacterized protein (TIGR04255 family)
MSFRPIHDEHGLEVAVFTVRMDKDVNTSLLNQNAKLWAETLPARAPVRAIVTTPGSKQPQVSDGIEYSFKKPDGSSTWSLRFAGPDIVVECRRFTSWTKVLARALSYFKQSLEILSTQKQENRKTIIALLVQYCFIYEGGAVSFGDILDEHNAGKWFCLGPQTASDFWHQHLGWVEPSEYGRTVNQLNIDIQSEQTFPLPPNLPLNAFLRVQHLQEVQIQSAGEIDLDALFSELSKLSCDKMRAIFNPSVNVLLSPGIGSGGIKNA